MSTHSFEVSVGEVHGPLELVLELVEQRKLLINDLSLAAVTDSFVERVKDVRAPVEEIAQFIQIATTLLLLKSRSLIPGLNLTKEEEGDIVDLTKRLELYQKIRASARYLRKSAARQQFFLAGERLRPVIFSAPQGLPISCQKLAQVARSLIKNLPSAQILPKNSLRILISMEEVMERILSRLEQALTFSFRSFVQFSEQNQASGVNTKANLIVSFLALLELAKRGSVLVQQADHSHDIIVEAASSKIPNYSL